ncbi:transcriptional regulator [Bifidobacterium dolichotidis]|uniref:Transcriptional regulator n=1 Tax=Bifidobacterium dolichotidis TaxID=2306976 RepID=A0A430FSN1_9BIFI|nr:LCP family protein [Bifidobacterium dolichotidis]RSX55869.1 transcriptional regulator [Bifidobacterium dolichotidis]
MNVRSNGSDSFDAGNAAPPSFVPMAERKPNATRNSANAAHSSAANAAPPSFNPNPQRQSGNHQAGNQQSAARQSSSRQSSPRQVGSQQSAAQQAQPQSFQPQSFQPNGQRTEARRSGSNRTASSGASASPNNSYMNSSDSSARMFSTPNGGGMKAKTKKPHRVRRTLVGLLAVILALIVALGIGTYSWVNGSLKKEAWPTTMAKGNATTWLILGSDERDGTTPDSNDGARTDTMLVLVKPKHGPSALISIPRDALVQIDGNYMKLNAVKQVYGNEQLIKEVQDITGQRVDHVAELEFGGLVKVVDALGGVQLCYDQDVDDEKSGMQWTAGCHVVDGLNALAFSRMRYSDPNSDFGRADRQRQVINAITKKAVSSSTLANIGKVKNIGDAALASVTVDEDTNPFVLLQMLMAFHSASTDKGISGTPYWTDPDYSVPGVGSTVLLDNEKNVELFKQLSEGSHAPGKVGTMAEQQQQ